MNKKEFNRLESRIKWYDNAITSCDEVDREVNRMIIPSCLKRELAICTDKMRSIYRKERWELCRKRNESFKLED